jgi:DNA-binding NarL/FixJ family response regulator
MDKIKLVLVDDNIPFRNALKKLLQKEFNADVIGEASNAEEFRKLKNMQMADVILMDVMMPGTDGITLSKESLQKQSNLKIIAITMHIDRVYLISLIEAGFKGCVNKSRLFEEINMAIHTVLKGKVFFPDYIPLE